ncbi:unnamed protein product, partial [Sphacelaria rigidula]
MCQSGCGLVPRREDGGWLTEMYPVQRWARMRKFCCRYLEEAQCFDHMLDGVFLCAVGDISYTTTISHARESTVPSHPPRVAVLNGCSLMQSIIAGCGSPTMGT